MNVRASSKTLVDEQHHWLYTGVTLTGKTTLARWHARILDRAGNEVIVFDPVGTETHGGGWPKNARMFDDVEKFVKHMDGATDAYVFIDEADEVFNHASRENMWMLKRGRHYGLYMRLMTQRPKMVAPNARTQVGRVFMFRLAKDDAREVCADMGHGADVYTIELDTGDCVMMQSGSAAIEQFNAFAVVPSTKPE